jgi:hypothetical protein
MRITESKLRLLVREALENNEDDEEELGFGGVPSWIWRKIPQGVMTTVSSKPITGARDTSENNMSATKPSGMWYAPGADWIDWMSREMPRWLKEVEYVYVLKPAYASGGLDSQGGVLQIKTARELRAFTKRFSFEKESPYVSEIRWDDVADQWDGIEIVPYHYDVARDMSMIWYAGWDIASGCIWRPRGVASLKLLASKPGAS